MARQANLFALLDDEETDDVSSLAERVAAKNKQREEEEQQKRQQEEKERQARSATSKFPDKHRFPARNVKAERNKPNGYQQNYGQHNGYLPDGRKADANGRGGGTRQDNGRRNDGHRRNEADNSQRKYRGRSAGHLSNGNWQGRGQQEFDNRAPSIESNQKLDSQGREDGNGGWESSSEKVNDKKEILSIDGDNNSVGAEGNLPINSERAKDSEPKKGKERPINSERAKDSEPKKGKERQADDDYYKKKAEERAKKRAEEEEDKKKMTLQEYEKMLLEKRKALEDLKTDGREVKLDKDFESMQVVDKKSADQVFIALKSEKDKLKKKIDAGKDEKVRKPVSINEFLKPAEDSKQEKRVDRRQHFNGRQGDGKQEQGGDGINDNRKGYSYVTLKDDPLKIEDTLQFPALGGAAKPSAQ